MGHWNFKGLQLGELIVPGDKQTVLLTLKLQILVKFQKCFFENCSLSAVLQFLGFLLSSVFLSLVPNILLFKDLVCVFVDLFERIPG